jgi:DNA-binding MarR family transcriptional regulator
MEEENNDFKGIWIPAEIWLDDGLTLQEKHFIVRIASLDNDSGCYANNEYFAGFFKISKTRVSIVINSLVKKGYITSTMIVKEGTQQILKRVLNISYRGYQTNLIGGIKQIFKDNNRINNRTNNRTNNNKDEKEFSSEIKEKTTAAKKEKSKKIIPVYPPEFSPEMIAACNDFFNYRVEIKKPYKSEKSLATKIKKFETELEQFGEQLVIDSITEAIANQYQGTFINLKNINNQQNNRNNGKSKEFDSKGWQEYVDGAKESFGISDNFK